MFADKTAKNDVLHAELDDSLIDSPSFDTPVDLDNAKFMNHLRQAFSSGFMPELDTWAGKDKE